MPSILLRHDHRRGASSACAARAGTLMQACAQGVRAACARRPMMTDTGHAVHLLGGHRLHICDGRRRHLHLRIAVTGGSRKRQKRVIVMRRPSASIGSRESKRRAERAPRPVVATWTG